MTKNHLAGIQDNEIYKYTNAEAMNGPKSASVLYNCGVRASAFRVVRMLQCDRKLSPRITDTQFPSESFEKKILSEKTCFASTKPCMELISTQTCINEGIANTEPCQATEYVPTFQIFLRISVDLICTSSMANTM